jgi:hypothetical protein
MKKTVAVSLLGVVVVVMALIYLFMGGDKAPGKSSAENFEAVSSNIEPPKKVLAEPSSGTGSLQEILAKAEDLECSISYKTAAVAIGSESTAEEPVTGTYFTSEGKMRGDFILPEALAGSVSSIIMRDNMMYNWSVIDGEKYGMKYDMTTLSLDQSTGEVPEAKGPVPVDQPVTYECKPWENVDGSIFEPPTDVLFRDVSDMKNINMEYGTSYEQTGLSAQCQLCEKVAPGPGQDECKATFKCQ